MLERCIMIFPEFDNMNIIDEIREKYDPLANHVRPHITLVFPFVSDIQANELKKHIQSVLSSTKPFRLTLKGITPEQTFGNYIFLNIEGGKEEIVKIHKKLYTNILEPYMPKWLKTVDYKPHMTLGNIEDEEEFKTAIDEVKDISNCFDTMVNKVSVEIIDKNEDSIIEMEILLG